jgi:hypothetical protein
VSARGIESRMLGRHSSKFRVRAFGAAIFLSGMGLISPPLAFTDSCVDWRNLNMIASLPKVNGITYVTYSAFGGGEVNSNAASAFAQWNLLWSTTGVYFTQATGSEVGNIQVGPDNGTHISADGCLSSAPAYGYINWGSDFNPDITNPSYASDARLSFAHEIGHLLGLDVNHTNQHTIMDQSTQCTPANPGFSNTETAPATPDATTAASCQELACLDS